MNTYSHDYALPSQAENALYEAWSALVQGNYATTTKLITTARALLQQYLADGNDNMVENPADDPSGYLRYSDIAG